MTTMTNIEQPAPPGGMERSEGGILVPQGQGSQLSPQNKKFLKIKEDLDLESLKGAILFRYLNATKSVGEDGVTYYNQKVEASEIAGYVMEELTYHMHIRAGYSGMTQELFNQLKAVKDISGKDYVTSFVETKMGFKQSDLESAFKKQGIGLEIVTGLTKNVSDSFYQKELSGLLESELGQDPEQYKSGIKNLQAVHQVGSSLTDETMRSLGIDKLGGAYIQTLEEVLEKLSKK